MHKSLMLCACESVYFILNVSKVSFVKIVNLIEIPFYELWKILDFYLKFDKFMPVPLKTHILNLE